MGSDVSLKKGNQARSVEKKINGARQEKEEGESGFSFSRHVPEKLEHKGNLREKEN